jgi:hypothetical protein
MSFWRTDILDPETNKTEAYKELALLEDHLLRPDHYCNDCTRKHLLKIEAYADECVSLSGGRQCQSLAQAAREWRARLAQGEAKASVARSVRAQRKEIGRQIPVIPRAGLPEWREWRHKPWVRYGIPAAAGFLLARWLGRR